ncbi:MAG TPA: NAD-dependent epimerase/dehydratase family protein, partial [Candidatus Coatesbacteria bacterium]|nr:NAD-dependent epimerase/dehydratase family protein [Candidatus Coatesbacteria bacterium]
GFSELDVSRGDGPLAKLFSDFAPELVVHAAAQVRVRCPDHLLDARYNVLGSLNVIHHAAERDVRRLVYISTGGAGYGEPDYLPCDEEHPIRPTSAYGVSKLTAEHYLRLYALEGGLDYAVIRPGNVYGPRQDSTGEAGVCAIFTGLMLAGKQPVIFGDGKNTRDYVYVGDVVEAVWLAATRPEASRRAYNVGTGRETSTREIFDRLASLTGYRGEPAHAPEPNEVKRICLDCARIKKELGWEPRLDLSSGLTRLVAWTSSGGPR